MTDLNHVVLVGRLTRDLGSDERSFGYLPSGQARANFSIAVNRSRKNGEQWEDEVNYFDITLFGRSAESLKPYLLKGKQVAIEGSLRQDRWEKDGQKFSKVNIIASNVQLLGGRSDSNGSSSQGGYTPRFQQSQGQASAPMQNDGGFNGADSSFPEDIPF